MKHLSPKRGKWLARLVVALPLVGLATGCILYLVALGRVLSHNLAPIVVAAAESSLQRQVRVGSVVAFDQPGKVVLVNVAVSNLATFAADHALAIRSHDPVKGLPAITADRVTVAYNLRSLLFDPGNATASLGDITVDSPTVYVERITPGRFNFTPLFQRKANPKKKPFKGEVLVQNGTVYFFDDTAPRSLQPAVNIFRDVSGAVNFHSDSAIYYAANGVGEPNRIASVALSGDVLRNDTPQSRAHAAQGYRLRLQAGRANAAYLGRYFLNSTAKVGLIDGGVANADVTISKIGRPKQVPLDITGTVDLAQGRLIVANRGLVDRPFNSVQGRFFFTGNGATIDAQGVVNGMPVAVSGAVFDFHHPQLALVAHAPRVDVAALREAFPFVPALPDGVEVAGIGALDLTFSGAAGSPVIQGQASLPAVDIAGNRLVNLRGQATFAGHLLTVKTITAQALAGGGTVEVHGLVDTTSRRASFLFSGTGRGVNLAAIHLPAAAFARVGPVEGVGDASFLATNRGKSGLAGPISLAADFTVHSAGARHVPLGQVSGRIFWRQGAELSLQDCSVQAPNGGLLLANGTIPAGPAATGGWNLTVGAARVRLAELLAPFHVTNIGGVAYFRGRVTGPMSTPEIEGQATVFNPHYGAYGADTLQAELSATAGGVRIIHGTINRFPATGTVTGTVTDLGANPRVALRVQIKHEDLNDIVAMATSRTTARRRPVPKAVANALPTVTGEASADLTVTGPLRAVRVTGTAEVADATIGAYRLDSAQASIGFAGDVVRVDNLVVLGEGARLAGGGEYQLATGRVAAQFRGDGIDIATITRNLSPDLSASGSLDFAGALTGSVKAPIVTAVARADNLTVDGVAFSQTQIGLRYADGVITNDGAPIRLASGGATYEVASLRYRPATRELAVTGSVTDETLPHLASVLQNTALPPLPVVMKARSVLGNLPAPLGGTLNVSSLSVHGPLDDLSGSIDATATDLVVGATRLSTARANLTYANHAITIGELDARGETAYLNVTGSVDPEGTIAAKLEASNISLAEFNPFLPRSVRLSGQLSDLTLVASGETRAPNLTASVTLEHPAYNQFSLDRVDSGQITLANGQITIESLSIVKTESLPGGKSVDHVASLYGSIPFAWRPGAFLSPEFPENGPVALHAEVPSQSLSVLTLFFPTLPASDFAGTIEAHVDLGGTFAHKSVTGALLLQNGAMHVPALKTGLAKMNADVTFAGSTATVQQFTAQSTEGGTITVTGTATMGAMETAGAGLVHELLGGIALNLNAVARNFTLDEPRIVALYDAGFHGRMNGSLHITRSLLAPEIAGGMNVAAATGSLPAEPATAAAPPSPVFDPRFAITVAFAKGSSLRSPQLNAQGDGTMTIKGSLGRPDVTGHFNVRSGRFAFPTAVFTIVPVGTVDLVYNPPDEIAERVYITATTSINIAQATLAANTPAAGAEEAVSYNASEYTPLAPGTSGHYQITVTIQGLLNVPNQLQLTFTSNPPGLLPQQIYAALGGQEALNTLAGGNVQLALQQEATQVFTSYAVPTLLSPVETGIAQTFGLENFSIDYSPLAPVGITLIKKVGPRELLTYTQLVTARQPGAVASTVGPREYQIKLEYNFTDRFGVYASTDDQQNDTLGLEGVFNFW